MFDAYFCSRVCNRLRSDPDAAVLEAFVGHLHLRKHSRFTIQNYVRAAELFLRHGFASSGEPGARLLSPWCVALPVGIGPGSNHATTAMRLYAICSDSSRQCNSVPAATIPNATCHPQHRCRL